MPVAAALLALAWIGGGTALDEGDHSGVVLAAHAVLMLAGFAGLTLAAGMAALYLWQARRLKRHERRVLRVRVPPLDALDRLAARASSARSCCSRSGSASAPPASSAATSTPRWRSRSSSGGSTATLLVLRHEGRRGRRTAS